MNINPQHLPHVDYPAPDPARPYVYPDTQVLINHFGIRSMPVLQRVVDTVAGLRGDRLERDPLAGDFDLPHLCEIHRALFQDIFAWAGQIRIVDTEKHGQDFVPAADIPGSFQKLHEELKAENFLRGLDPEEFAGRLAHYWYGVYAVHVFRDGNSRAMRHFFAGLAAEAGYRLDFAAVDRAELLTACRNRYFKDDMAPLRDCLRQISDPV
ncbi:MAG: Fic family protein [Sulfuritalea sp.]|nr:Fic family protein [Sulfuritalea sp.]